MHDWTLKTISLCWEEGTLGIDLVYCQGRAQIIVEAIKAFSMTQKEEWGPSVSVNQVKGPYLLENGNFYMLIEMQSGDEIKIEAENIIINN